MSNTKNSNSNSSKSVNSKKGILIIVGCAVVFVAVAIVTIFLALNRKKNTFDVGFYQVPENISTFIEKRISQLYTEKLTFSQIEDSELSEKKFGTKYDIIFCPNGSFVESVSKYTKRNSPSLYSNMPRAITDKTQITVPLILDYYEFAYYRPSRASAVSDIPQTMDDFESYLEKSKKAVFTPFFCAGGDDKTLLALVSVFVESYGGSSAYNDFVQLVQKEAKLKSVSKKKFQFAGENSKSFTIIDILDIFRGWKDKEMVHPDWYSANFNDVKAFMEEKQIGVAFMPLSLHRTISYKVIRDFESDRIPIYSAKDNYNNHGLIAPEYVGIKFSNDARCDEIFADLVEENAQTNFSDQTKLAPINSRCAAFDRQSDDARFFAAACKDGPIPPLYNAAFQTNEKALHEFAEQIRTYLRLGVLE